MNKKVVYIFCLYVTKKSLRCLGTLLFLGFSNNNKKKKRETLENSNIKHKETQKSSL